MPTVWENSYVEGLRTLSGLAGNVPVAVANVRRAVEPLILPDAAKILTAIAADVVVGIQSRNQRVDVQDAHAALRKAIALLEAIDPDLDG